MAITTSLGAKHKAYNEAVHDAIAINKELGETSFNPGDDDLDNLVKIDIASHKKDLDYILSVLTSNDMLYVSRALKHSAWLTEEEYAHVINAKYLQDHLFPRMMTKAWIKLRKHILENLKSETRAEEFYSSEAAPKAAVKWLKRCSVPFIEAKIENHMEHLEPSEFKRLCEKSVTIFEKGIKACGNSNMLNHTAPVVLRTRPHTYLDVVENLPRHSRPTFGKNLTQLLMETVPERITNKFLFYARAIHIPTFIKYLPAGGIKDFLNKLTKEEIKLDDHILTRRNAYGYDIFKHFIRKMPKEEQCEFIKQVILNKDNVLNIKKKIQGKDADIYSALDMCVVLTRGTPVYKWYEFFPFDVAFSDMKKLIELETDESEQYSMLKVLTNCAGKNLKNIYSVLIYYNKTNLTREYESDFIDILIAQVPIYKQNDETWKEFKKILERVKARGEGTENLNNIVFLHHTLNGTPVPEDINNKIQLDDMKSYRKQLSQEEQNKLFPHLYDKVMDKISNHKIENEKSFDDHVDMLNSMLDLLVAWDKELDKYPVLLTEIKVLIQTRSENNWKVDLSSIYNKKKSWKKLMFEDSVKLNPSQDVCLNALKHDPELLMRYKSDVEEICSNDKISLKKVHKKLRIYLPDIAKAWEQYYFEKLNTSGSVAAHARGLLALLHQKPLHDFVLAYAPKQPKIDWDDIKEATLGLQRSLAKYMHTARPQPAPDAVLLYAKGDYLQYSLPSLLAIFYNMSYVQNQEYIPKLLDSPVSSQKHGIRFASQKLKSEELSGYMTNAWNKTKNESIRAITFEIMFKALCNSKDDVKSEHMWSILEVFIDNLTFKENKSVYDTLTKVDKVPINIKPKMLVKSYLFLKKLIPHTRAYDRQNYEYRIERLAADTRDVVESVSPDFVSGIVSEYPDRDFTRAIISAFLLRANNEETQRQRYEQLLKPAFKRKDFASQRMLSQLARDLNEYTIKNKLLIPKKLFSEILKDLDDIFSERDNYVMLTMWKLTTKITELIDGSANRESWSDVCAVVMPVATKYFLEVLKSDVKSHFPCIYLLFSKALTMTVDNLSLSQLDYLTVYENMLYDKDFIESYLVTIKSFSRSLYLETEECKDKNISVRNILSSHPSLEVRMHYNQVLKNIEQY